jgi:cell division protein FtsL
MLMRLNIVLVVAILATSLYLIRTAHDARRLYADIDRARNQQRQLDIELKHLEAERHAQATNLRVEKVARDRLAMRPATPAVTHYVVDPAPEAAR